MSYAADYGAIEQVRCFFEIAVNLSTQIVKSNFFACNHNVVWVDFHGQNGAKLHVQWIKIVQVLCNGRLYVVELT